MRAERNLFRLARVLAILTAPFVRYEIRGGRCVPDLRTAVVAANHRSLFDVIAGLVCVHHIGRYPRLMIERRYVEGRWTGPFARAIGAIPVDRDAGGRAAFDVGMEALRDGIPIIVMPEGKLHWDPANPRSLGPSKTGVSRLARGAGVPVLPAALSGTERVMPAEARLPRLNPFRRKTVVANLADDPLWLTSDDHRANTDQIMEAVRALMVD